MKSHHRNVSRFFRIHLAAVVVLIAGCGDRSNPGSQTNRPPSDAATAFDVSDGTEMTVTERMESAISARRQGQLKAAWDEIGKAMIVAPDDANVLRLAAEIQRDRGVFQDAASFARRAADADKSMALSMRLVAFDCHLRAGDFANAEADLKRAAETHPNVAQVHRYLGQLLNAQGRRQEACGHVLQLIRLREIAPNELLSLIDRRGPFFLSSFDQFVDAETVSMFTLGRLRYLLSNSRTDPSELLDQIDAVMDAFPQSTAAAALRCRMLADSGRMEQLQESLGGLPDGIEQQPEYWYAIGVLLASQDRHDEAIRAFAEALQLDPTDRESLRNMIASFNLTDRTEEVVALQERLGELDQVFRIARDADHKQSRWISETLQNHLRPWESTAWLMHAERMSGNLPQIIPELNRRHASILRWEQETSGDQRQQARLAKFLGFESDSWPLPDLKSLSVQDATTIVASESSELRLNDVAASVGLETTYISEFPLDGSPYALFQVNGGGLAAWDFDLDGRCDIYVVQSGGEPVTENTSLPNQLFRQLPGNRFVEVTFAAGVGDRGYGQGVCVGDVNQDGFPDLIVANIGPNRVYLNQGDGTFVEDTSRITDNPFAWTSSIALADLNGDHLPEMVEINYVDDTAAFSTRCQENYLDCQPQAFQKAQDRVLVGRSDGTFEPWQSFAEASPTARLGFGIVVANFDRKRGNDFFVTNDGDFNHFWTSVEATGTDAAPFQLAESAAVFGCSVGRGGDSQACMGIAFGDLNRDGTLDLHVTNFRSEPVNLFVQSGSGTFTDLASRFGLAAPSMGVLGFGTQAADLDNDGWLDLAVLNGHVYDARFEETPLQMLPQLFRGGKNKFVSQDPASIGDYWKQEAIGRTLVSLDWNRDGKLDFLANHLDLPVALLENQSKTQDWLQLELVGVGSERDAIGAEMVVEVGDQKWTSWQIGGDGFMCTNESMVHFGLGTAEVISQVEITWPSGTTQTFVDVAPNRRYLLVEGVGELHER